MPSPRRRSRLEPPVKRLRSRHEQLDRLLLAERGDREHVLAGDVENGSTRHDHLEPRGTREQPNEERAETRKVLGVVGDQEKFATGEPLGEIGLVRPRAGAEHR